MTTAQREQLNRFLAEKVMGWTEGEYEHDGVYMSASGIECFVAHWNPLRLLRDCTLLLDKIEQDGWRWNGGNNVDNGYGFDVWEGCGVARRNGHGWSKDSRTQALCLAIARCYGWKEEV